ncbi:Flagellar basal-body rod protein FlgG [bioreactor metagenome]|uniref:Flagellar basal-body rod protein FlgG n=1 Tax=bioreactor metagenome TaxID=1076179 RepID=A0A644XQ62_9ZZZZ
MLKSLSSAVSGLQSHQTMMDVIGNNIANVSTAGYQSSRVTFSDVYYQTLRTGNEGTATAGGTNGAQVGYGSQVASIDVLHSTGGMTTTNRTLDQYIDGSGYFVLQDANKNEFYSKVGHLYFDAVGNLVDSGGNFVMGASGGTLSSGYTPEIINVANLADYSSISISATGIITGVDSTGTTATLGQIGLASFVNQDALLESGGCYYAQSSNSGAPTYGVPGETAVGTLVSGALEASNVDLSKEFTEMITAQRGFQANARVITTSDEILQELVNLKR